MSLYDSFKNSYDENKEYIKKVLSNKAPTSFLGEDAILVLNYLIKETKAKIKNKPKDLKSFTPVFYLPTKILNEATGLSSARQLKALKKLKTYGLIDLYYRKDDIRHTTARIVRMIFTEFKDFYSRCKLTKFGSGESYGWYDEPEDDSY